MFTVNYDATWANIESVLLGLGILGAIVLVCAVTVLVTSDHPYTEDEIRRENNIVIFIVGCFITTVLLMIGGISVDHHIQTVNPQLVQAQLEEKYQIGVSNTHKDHDGYTFTVTTNGNDHTCHLTNGHMNLAGTHETFDSMTCDVPFSTVIGK